MNIEHLMRVHDKHRCLRWLKDALQTAIELELSTIPPYLIAWWSIKDAAEVYTRLRRVATEEMSHLGLTCNLLTTIGGTPELATHRAAPTYPGPLPGGVRPGLVVPLVGLTRQLVREVFMEIEYPESGPIALVPPATSPTIGQFYTAIAEAFERNQAAITGERQLTFLQGFAIASIKDVRTAITQIKEQGEGTSQSPDAVDVGGGKEVAHYYSFAEIYHGKQLVADTSGVYHFNGPDVPFPEVVPVAEVPRGGYPPYPLTPHDIGKKLDDFDTAYTTLLQKLEQAWQKGDESILKDVIQTDMFNLSTLARGIMRSSLDGGGYMYAPCFRLTVDC